MGFDITNLPTWVSQVDKKIFQNAVYGSTTAKDLIAAGSVIYGKPGNIAVRKLSNSVTFQSGNDNCARNASGDITLGSATCSLVRFKSEKNICYEDLDNTYYSLLLTDSIQPSEEKATPEFANALIQSETDIIKQDVERAFWIGDTGLTASFGTNYQNFNKFKGILKQVTDGAEIGMTLSGSTMTAKIQNAILVSMPANIYMAEDFRVAIGEDLYNQYTAALANQNIFRPTDDKTVFGTSFKFWVVPGLNGTNKIVALRLSNLRLPINKEDDTDSCDLSYIKDSVFHGWGLDTYWSAGICVIDPAEVGYLVYS